MKNLFFKIFSGYILVTIILSVLILSISFTEINKYNINVLTENLTRSARALSLSLNNYFNKKDYAQLQKLVKKLDQELKLRITVIEASGRVVADSENDPASMKNHLNRAEVITAVGGKVGRDIRLSDTLQKKFLYVAIPIINNGKITGVLRVSFLVKDISRVLNHLYLLIIVTAGTLILIFLLITLWLSRDIVRPLQTIENASREIAEGNFSSRVILDTPEFQNLAESFNRMSEQLQNNFTELRHQKENLHSIIESIQEGLAVISLNGKITLCNNSFRRIVNHSEPEQKYYWEVLREPEFGSLLKTMQSEKKNFTSEVSASAKTFQISGSFLYSGQEMVILLKDITADQDLEKVKRDFVVNVSHELRTPLTAIKGFVETLAEEVPPAQKRYVEIIGRHTERLVNIVQDLLLLSELEEKGFQLQLEKVNLKNILENIKTIFENKLKEKGLYLKIEAALDLPEISGDVFKLEQVFINLIDNSLKYTDQGGIKITLKTLPDKIQDKIQIEVSDTGIGIPAQDLPRIFERFYVVDKSRSRKLGGTGLGLSIVKHIVLLHNGELKVESRTGQGTTFRITLPK